MTIIAAIPTGDSVLMATDSRLVRNDSVLCQTAKVVRKKSRYTDVLIAASGNARLFALACHALTIDDGPDPTREWECDTWAHTVAVALAELAADARPPVLDDGQVDGEALLAYAQHLWLLNGQSAIRITTPFAIGSGSPEARGALHAAGELGLIASDPCAALSLAVQAAIALDVNCGGDVLLISSITRP